MSEGQASSVLVNGASEGHAAPRAGGVQQCELCITRSATGEEQRFSLRTGGPPLRIGRGPKNGVVLDVPGVSNVHAELLLRLAAGGGGSGSAAGVPVLCIRDRSKNGVGIRPGGVSEPLPWERAPAGELRELTRDAVLKVPLKSRTGDKQLPDGLRMLKLRLGESVLVAAPELPRPAVAAAAAAAPSPGAAAATTAPAPPPTLAARPGMAPLAEDGKLAEAAAVEDAYLCPADSEAAPAGEKLEDPAVAVEPPAAPAGLGAAVVDDYEGAQPSEVRPPAAVPAKATELINLSRLTSPAPSRRPKAQARRSFSEPPARVAPGPGAGAPGASVEALEMPTREAVAKALPLGDRRLKPRRREKAAPPPPPSEGFMKFVTPVAEKHVRLASTLTKAALEAMAEADAGRQRERNSLVGYSVLRDMSVSPISTPGVGRKKKKKRVPREQSEDVGPPKGAAQLKPKKPKVELDAPERKRPHKVLKAGLDAMAPGALSPPRWRPASPSRAQEDQYGACAGEDSGSELGDLGAEAGRGLSPDRWRPMPRGALADANVRAKAARPKAPPVLRAAGLPEAAATPRLAAVPPPLEGRPGHGLHLALKPRARSREAKLRPPDKEGKGKEKEAKKKEGKAILKEPKAKDKVARRSRSRRSRSPRRQKR